MYAIFWLVGGLTPSLEPKSSALFCQPIFLLGTTSGTPTLLRLTPSFDGGDGRFVHSSVGQIQSRWFRDPYFQVHLDLNIRG